MPKAIYPGSFDPFTSGHLDIASRAVGLFGNLVIAVYTTPSKGALFSAEERVEMARKSVEHLPNVEVSRFSGLVVDFARAVGANVIVRGLRTGSDFEYEFEMAFMNRQLAPDIELVCLMTRPEYQFVSATLLKEVATLKGDIEGLVPPHVAAALERKLSALANSAPGERGMSSTS